MGKKNWKGKGTQFLGFPRSKNLSSCSYLSQWGNWTVRNPFCSSLDSCYPYSKAKHAFKRLSFKAPFAYKLYIYRYTYRSLSCQRRVPPYAYMGISWTVNRDNSLVCVCVYQNWAQPSLKSIGLFLRSIMPAGGLHFCGSIKIWGPVDVCI